MKKLRFWRYIVIVSSIVLMLGQVPVANALSTCGTLGNFFDGGKERLTVWGAKAEIETQNPNTCPNGDSMAWSMVSGPNLGDYVQVGWEKNSAWTGPQWFYEWNSSITGNSLYWHWGSASGFNLFTVTYAQYPDGDRWLMKINSNSVAAVYYSQLAWSPAGPQFAGELWDAADQVPGSKLNPVSISYAKRQTTKGGSWTNASLTPYISSQISDNARSNLQSGGNSFEIWDNRY